MAGCTPERVVATIQWRYNWLLADLFIHSPKRPCFTGGMGRRDHKLRHKWSTHFNWNGQWTFCPSRVWQSKLLQKSSGGEWRKHLNNSPYPWELCYKPILLQYWSWGELLLGNLLLMEGRGEIFIVHNQIKYICVYFQ